jgi:hypothetical protein
MIRKLGTICCHIQPQNGGSPSSSSASGSTPKYGLSACHVVLSTSISETPSREVVCPGSLDMLAALSRELPGGVIYPRLKELLAWAGVLGRSILIELASIAMVGAKTGPFSSYMEMLVLLLPATLTSVSLSLKMAHEQEQLQASKMYTHSGNVAFSGEEQDPGGG